MHILTRFNKPTDEQVEKSFQLDNKVIEENFNIDSTISICNVVIYYLVSGLIITHSKITDGAFITTCTKDNVPMTDEMENESSLIHRVIATDRQDRKKK